MFNSHGFRPQFDANCDDFVAHRTGFCSAFDDKAMLDFSRRSYREIYRQGSEIAAQGEVAERVGIIASGLVKTVVLTEGGDEYVLQILRSGHLIGNPENELSGFSCQAVTDTAIRWMPRTSWHAFLQSHPQIFLGCLAALNQQFEELQLSLVKMRGRTAVQRLAFWLLEQASGATENSMPQIRLLLSRRDLASLLNMTTETLCRALHQIEERGAIHLLAPDRLKIIDPERLRRLAKYHDERIGAALAEPAHAPRLSQHSTWSERGKVSMARPTRLKMAGPGKPSRGARDATTTPSERH